MQRSTPTIAGLMILVIVAAFGLALFQHDADGRLYLYAIAASLLLPYVLGPLKIHQTQWVALEPDYKPFDPRGPESPPEVSEYYDEVEGELARLGFSFVRSYRTKNSTPNATGSVTLFGNRSTSEVAKLISAVAGSGLARNVACLLVLSTEFADGTEVVTSNSRTPRIYPPRRPPFHSFAFPQIRQAGRLLAVHRALVRRFEGGRIRIDPVGDDPDEYLRDREHRRPLAHHVECGYNYRDEAAGVQRPTWKGAVLMTWKLLWPAKPIGLSLRRVRARRLLRELESERQ